MRAIRMVQSLALAGVAVAGLVAGSAGAFADGATGIPGSPTPPVDCTPDGVPAPLEPGVPLLRVAGGGPAEPIDCVPSDEPGVPPVDCTPDGVPAPLEPGVPLVPVAGTVPAEPIDCVPSGEPGVPPVSDAAAA